MKSAGIYGLIAIAATIPLGCNQSDSSLMPEKTVRVEFSDLSGIEQNIAANIMAEKFGGFDVGAPHTRALSGFSISPVMEDGDTLMYLVQYDEGWEIFSANLHSPMKLFSSETGNYQNDESAIPDQLRFLIEQNGKVVREMANDSTLPVNKTWGPYAITDSQLANGKITSKTETNQRRTVSQQDLPPGTWELLRIETIKNDRYTSPKLILTKWGQEHPWNIYAKWTYTDNTYSTLIQCPAGCTPVAVSQYMYYTHHKDGYPVSTVSSAQRTSNLLDYTFSGSSSDLWDSMALNKSQNDSDQAALLIGKAGRDLHSSYTLWGTGTTIESCAAFLSNVYGVTYTPEPYSFDIVKQLIDNGYPVVSRATSSGDTSNGSTNYRDGKHTFIIDQYNTVDCKYKYIYYLKRDPLPAGTIDRWMSDDLDENGNVIQYAYTNEVINDINYKEISMNWGWDGECDDVFYHTDGSWNPLNYNYIIDQIIYIIKN